MKNFRRIEGSFVASFMPLLSGELLENDSLWIADESRQRKISVQRHTQSIFLRGAVRDSRSSVSIKDVQESGPSPFASSFPATLDFLKIAAKHEGGKLSRALYARLFPHSIVYPHIDRGAYYASRNRYHLIVFSPGGSYMKCGMEEVVMREGELWWFDNKEVHESANHSEDWRVHLIFDLLPIRPAQRRRDRLEMWGPVEKLQRWAKRFGQSAGRKG
jgi:hypothetical protein